MDKRHSARGASRLCLLILVLVVAGCGSATPTPIVIYVTPPPTPTVAPSSAPPTPSPTPSPTPTPTPTPTPSLPPTIDLPALSGKVSGASKTRYYAVIGNSPTELMLGLTANCSGQSWLCVPGDNGWQYQTRTLVATGYCSVTSATTTYKPTARVPRLTGPSKVYPELFDWWRQVLGHITAGEAALIKIQRSADAKFPKLLVGKRCSLAKGIISKWDKSTTAAFAAYYKKDALWQVPLYVGP